MSIVSRRRRTVSWNVGWGLSVRVRLKIELIRKIAIRWMATLYISGLGIKIIMYSNVWCAGYLTTLEFFINWAAHVIGWVILRTMSLFCRNITWVRASSWLMIRYAAIKSGMVIAVGSGVSILLTIETLADCLRFVWLFDYYFTEK